MNPPPPARVVMLAVGVRREVMGPAGGHVLAHIRAGLPVDAVRVRTSDWEQDHSRCDKEVDRRSSQGEHAALRHEADHPGSTTRS
jgi:hypothetical protein